MNILLVSQCSQRALAETRHILDQFAERRGERVWQTPITKAGLDTVHRLLRKTARKNTAVACHWIRGLDHSELMWIVGDASRFNAQGAVPTNATRADVLRQRDENTWHSLKKISLLVEMAALLHDIGKACLAFQKRLKGMLKLPNLYRHEWISLRLFQAFVGNDDNDDWLRRLADPASYTEADWLKNLHQDGLDPATLKPLENLPPLAKAVAWLFISHHRLPSQKNTFTAEFLDKLPEAVTAAWNQSPAKEQEKIDSDIQSYWKFPKGLPMATEKWRQRAAAVAQKMLGAFPPNETAPLDDPYIMHLARLTLMLADHTYSGFTDPADRERGQPEYPLFANTTQAGERNQRLDEHILGVARLGRSMSRALPHLALSLPRLARHRGLSRRATQKRFQWQNTAAELANAIRERSRQQGAFIVNMASTGCGKTLANARIMYALANPALGLRCAFALGLRTLTRQTGQEYRHRLGLEREVGIVVGGAASAELYEHYLNEREAAGAESAAGLLPEDSHVLYEDAPGSNPVLNHVLRDPQARGLLAAPLLCCTIDHLIAATESLRGGRQIVPMLRLLSGDLVLDEVDDYDVKDLPAVTRLVYWAGLLGCRVLVSSATLPPALLQGMFEAYREGRLCFQKNQGERPAEQPPVCCAWVDEHKSVAQDCPDGETFAAAHTAFVEKRAAKLLKAVPRRKAELVPLIAQGDEGENLYAAVARQILRHAVTLHRRHNTEDPHSGKQVSFGLARLANIKPLFEVALELFKQEVPPDVHIHLCVYHSQFPLLLRSAMEARLDAALKRHNRLAVFDLPDIRQRLDRHNAPNHIFLVVGSPVTEVGRDHDYDWAIIEPSSMRSIIQLAGRIWRHGEDREPNLPNIMIFERNIKSLEKPGEPAYCHPGFEDTDDYRFADHCLRTLLPEEDYKAITARPRILPRAQLEPQMRLADLEHYRLRRLMLPGEQNAAPAPRRQRDRGSGGPEVQAYSCWRHKRAMLAGLLQKKQKFRDNSGPKDTDLVLLSDEDGQEYILTELFREKPGGPAKETPVEKSKNTRVEPENTPPLSLWGADDYMAELHKLAGELDMDLTACARRYGTLTLPKSVYGWKFHPGLGFTVKKDEE